MREQIAQVLDVAWDGYSDYRKSPRTQKAGAGFADPEFELPLEWLQTRERIREAQARHDRASSRRRVLLISAAARSDQTCPGETPKTFRLAQIARKVFAASDDVECDFLDLSHLTS